MFYIKLKSDNILFAEYSSVRFTKVHVVGIRYIGFNQAEKWTTFFELHYVNYGSYGIFSFCR